jgi:hypothetical protein
LDAFESVQFLVGPALLVERRMHSDCPHPHPTMGFPKVKKQCKNRFYTSLIIENNCRYYLLL